MLFHTASLWFLVSWWTVSSHLSHRSLILCEMSNTETVAGLIFLILLILIRLFFVMTQCVVLQKELCREKQDNTMTHRIFLEHTSAKVTGRHLLW